MLFVIPILAPDTYVEEQMLYTNSIALLVREYNKQKSWAAYQNTLKVIEESSGMWSDDLDAENYYPAIVLKVVDPNGKPWGTDIVEIFPNEGLMNTNEHDYRSHARNNVKGIANNGVEFSIVYSVDKESQAESMINLARTVWVIFVLTIAAIHFSNATNRLVLHPLERMLEIVKKIAKDPSSAAASDEMQTAGIYMYMN